MPSRFRIRQAGEGKVGCFITAALLIIAIAVAIKGGPIYYSNNELISSINNDIAPMASRATDEEILSQVRAKAKDLNIPEALQPGAIKVSIRPSSGDTPGDVNISLHYERPVDFFGVYTYNFVTNESIDRTVFTDIK